MAISFSFADINSLKSLQKAKTKSWIKQVIEQNGKKIGDISYVFCSDDYLLEINKTYLNHDYYTDIITFDYSDDIIISGDLMISVDRIKDNASELNVSFEQEFYRVIIHGVLHLLGYKDKTDKEAIQMRKAEDECLRMLML